MRAVRCADVPAGMRAQRLMACCGVLQRSRARSRTLSAGNGTAFRLRFHYLSSQKHCLSLRWCSAAKGGINALINTKLKVGRCLCLVFPPPSWLRHCLCLVFPPPSWLKHCLCLRSLRACWPGWTCCSRSRYRTRTTRRRTSLMRTSRSLRRR